MTNDDLDRVRGEIREAGVNVCYRIGIGSAAHGQQILDALTHQRAEGLRMAAATACEADYKSPYPWSECRIRIESLAAQLEGESDA